jgi:N-glycosylase/DNA lyase
MLAAKLSHCGDATLINNKTKHHQHNESTCTESIHKRHEQILSDYFQLGVNVTQLYTSWSDADANFKAKAQDFTGIRILRQNPVENLFSFICSSNNNISRISLMIEKMCERFGEKIAEIDNTSYHSFPTIETLANRNVDQHLRTLGFGYRAKYIVETAQYITNHHSEAWLYELRNKPYEEAKIELMKLCGVGAKVSV